MYSYQLTSLRTCETGFHVCSITFYIQLHVYCIYCLRLLLGTQVTTPEEKNTSNMKKLAILLMACIIIGFLQVNCTVFSYFEYVGSVNMYNSTLITQVAIVKVMCHKSVICHAFIANCRKIKCMEVTF